MGEQDEEEDIRSRVASMLQESEEEDDDSDANPDSPRSARKRKQGKLQCHSNRNLTSPTSSPSKRARKLQSPNGATALPENLLQCSSAPAVICQNSRKKYKETVFTIGCFGEKHCGVKKTALL